MARTFDTPGFAGMTFYEVQAKSIINRVPASSRMSFMWTVNPYRGCSHACSYCLAGDTPILMADGSTRALRDLKVGDAIYGTVPVGTSRRYTVTTVLAHWSTTKPAYRVTLADGTQLIASGDHRFLSERGWRQVAEGPRGPGLAAGDQFMGTGQFAEGPKDSADYRRGYLSGMIRGDAHLATYAPEAVDRSLDYLAGFGAATIDAIRDLIRWPDRVSDDWCKGFLAGVFDSDGSRDGRDLWIRSNDTEILDQIAAALRRFGFDAWLESSHAAVRLRGGLTEHMRFYHLADPAISRKRSISGRTVGSDARLRVVSIEPLGVDLPLYDITTGTADFIANGVVSHNCFARGTHTYLDLDAGHDFDTKVVVKVNAGELVRRELAAPKWRGEHIAMGTNVDPYQRAEGRYRLMPRILSALRDFANPFSILTKGTLILRDLPLLRQAAEVTQVGVAMSVGFVDERMWRSVESGTPSPRRRLDAVRALTDAGFRVSVLMAPILPGLTDTEESIEATVTAIAASGAASVTPIPLHLRPGAREWYASWLTREFPALAPHYRRLYGRGSYLPKEYQREVTARVRMAARRHGLDRTEPGEARQTEPPPQPPEPEQLTLL
ncbi:intein-containing Rv2578c family radical SAM protein [Phytohabitans flavus]|uniref:intein-containing Rv2578c family radical SAM protein n=1 Tax=Phytohabitans flavus TaxID=1076124 RepID=UPI00363EC973